MQKNNLTDNKWNQFKEKSDLIGLTGLAIHITRMGQVFLGFPEEHFSWCSGAEQKVCDILFDYSFKAFLVINKAMPA